jgi:hypothetical protein
MSFNSYANKINTGLLEEERYNIKVKVPVQFKSRLQVRDWLEDTNFPGTSADAALRSFIAQKARKAGIPENEIGLLIWYARNNNPIIKVVPKVEPIIRLPYKDD